MILAALRTGAVIRFPYLWAREAADGETEGRKFRPVTVGVRIPKPKGEDVLVLFPITSQQPASGRFAAEIPDLEKRRAGLRRQHPALDCARRIQPGCHWPLLLPGAGAATRLFRQGILSALAPGVHPSPLADTSDPSQPLTRRRALESCTRRRSIAQAR